MSDAGDEQARPMPGPRGRRRHSRRAKIFGAISVVVVLALVVGSLAAYVKYRDIWDSIHRVNISADLGGKRPAGFGNAMNILVIGSDSRTGENGKIGGSAGISGARSDTVMVVHISPSPHHVVVLSFPRDSVVPIYQCAAEDGTSGQQADTSQVEQLNSTFAYGGPGCLWKTIEQTTHIRLDDFMELTFVGFEKVIDDLGGVNVCLPENVNDPMSGLKLSRGRHHIYGKQALAFWRTREDLGLGSDLQRIERDQFLMIALLHGIEQSDLLASPTRLTSVISDVAKNMTTDSGLSQSRLLQIASGLRGLTSEAAQFIEVPTVPYPGNPEAWVQWTPADSQLFSAIARNNEVPKETKNSDTPLSSKAQAAKTQTAATVKPSQVNVDVLNGSGVAGIAAVAASGLTSRGFTVTGNGNAASFSYTSSVIQYAPGDKADAQTLQAQLSNVTLQEVSSLSPGAVNLILGSSFSALSPKSSATSSTSSSSKSSSVSNLTKTYGGLTGNTDVCNDKSAFAS